MTWDQILAAWRADERLKAEAQRLIAEIGRNGR